MKGAIQLNPRCKRIRSKNEFYAIESADLNTAATVPNLDGVHTCQFLHSSLLVDSA